MTNICTIEDCNAKVRTRGWCTKHYQRWIRTGDPLKTSRAPHGEGKPFKMKDGYVKVPNQHAHPNSDKRGRIMQHILVMTEQLGRPLYPGENVHHKNGVKDDNRPENLELWVTSQPSGQRPEDLVEWAEEILRRYRPKKVQ